MTISAEILRSRLAASFSVTALEVDDESHLHAGHAGARHGGRHFRVSLTSEDFRGVGRVERSRKVYALFQPELDSGALHALALHLAAPGEGSLKS